MSRSAAYNALSRMNMTEVLVSPAAQHLIIQDLQQLAGVKDETLEEAAAEKRMGELVRAYGYNDDMAREKPFAFSEGVAIIPIHGTLINRFHGSWSYVTGYNYIRAQLNYALDDDDVKLVVFDVNSYGGEKAGCFELAGEIFEARSRKKMMAMVDSNCCSAAFALASGAPKIVVTPSGQAGSVGVIAMHMNVAKMMQDFGIEVTIIAEGAHKADGNPYEPLSKSVLAEIRADVSKSYDEFVKLVAKNRKMSEKDIRDTESRSYRADEALALGFIDAVQTPAQAVSAYMAELGSDEPLEDEDEMATADPKADAAATAQAAADARTAERTRIAGITTSADGKDRPILANYLAMETDMSVEDATKVLAKAGKETISDPKPAEAAPAPAPAAVAPAAPAPASTAFTAAMDASKQPEVGADPAPEGEGAAKPSRAKQAMGWAGMETEAKGEKSRAQRALAH